MVQQTHPGMRRALVVDSIVCDLRAIFWLLQEAGFEITYAATGRIARELEDRFDAMILDVQLDDGSGVDLAGEFLATGKTASVVFYSDEVPARVLREALSIGPVLLKRNGPTQLLEALRVAKKPESHFPQAGELAHARSRGERISSQHGRHQTH
jgi:DNA-binding NarL/FixJ family response regulator